MENYIDIMKRSSSSFNEHIEKTNKEESTDTLNTDVLNVLKSMFIPISQANYEQLVNAGTVDNSKYYLIMGE